MNLSRRNKVYQGECLQLLSEMPDQCVDLVFADPPYNLQLKGNLHRPDDSRVDGVTDAWDKFESFKSYDSFCRDWLRECRRVLKPDGSIWVIGSYHNIFRLGSILQDLGYWILNDVVWRKTNPMPNFRGRRFTNAHETLIWAARSEKSKYCFNYDSMKALNEDLQMRSDWTLPLCTGHERLKTGSGRKAHPTQKPEALLYRVILSSSMPGDLVLDPFSGSGTTAAVAKMLGRDYIAFEMDKDYVRLSRDRLKTVESIENEELIKPVSKRSQPRIPFGSLIEQGILKAGATLMDPKERYKAKVTADGNLIAVSGTQKHRGSIHKVGAALEGRPSCNGWTYWHFKSGSSLLPIDSLREQIRQSIS